MTLLDLVRSIDDVEELPTPTASKFRPLSTSSVFAAKTILDEHKPFVRETDVNGAVYIILNEHFIYSMGLALQYTDTDYQFSPAESTLWDQYISWVTVGTLYTADVMEVLTVLDLWLVDDILNITHPEITTTYNDSHPWIKIQTRTY